MKLDKIKFAQLVGWLSQRGFDTYEDNIVDLDAMIDIEPLQMADNAIQHNASDINNLMALMADGTRKIEAIKMHRKLTGLGLKESKEEVEKHWNNRPTRDLIQSIKDALGTEENGFALVEVARNAHKAERELASMHNFEEPTVDNEVV